MNDLECPYCGAENDVCHDDGEGYEEDKTHEMECCQCGKNFVFHTSISFHYHPSKADCLNGSPHRFTEWRHLWTDKNGDEKQIRCCRDCLHEERRLFVKPKELNNSEL